MEPVEGRMIEMEGRECEREGNRKGEVNTQRISLERELSFIKQNCFGMSYYLVLVHPSTILEVVSNTSTCTSYMYMYFSMDFPSHKSVTFWMVFANNGIITYKVLHLQM